MNKYEVLTNNLKIRYLPNFKIKKLKYTQVSCFVFNENKELLIVKVNNKWVIPGGHPELGETSIATLKREVLEEACLTVKNIIYLGAVEVLENNDTYYQLRYMARLDKINDFSSNFESAERKFVNLKHLEKYITFANGITFKKQIQSVIKYL